MTLDSWYSFLLDNKLYKIKKITGKAIIDVYKRQPLQIINVDTTYISLRDYNSWVGGKPQPVCQP